MLGRKIKEARGLRVVCVRNVSVPREALTVRMTGEQRPKEVRKCSYLEEHSSRQREQPVQRP